MRAHRITLLVSKAEKERIARQAASLGTCEGDYVRKTAMLLDADDVAALEDVRSLLPEFDAALTRIHNNLVAAAERSEKHHREIERMRSAEYRQEIYRELETNQAGLEAVAALFGVGPSEQTATEPKPAKDGKPDESTSKRLRPRPRVNEEKVPWRDGDTGG